MPGDPLFDLEGIKPGQVLMVSEHITPRDGRDPWWWKSFRVVTRRMGPYLYTYVLRMEVTEKDERLIYLPNDKLVVQTMAEREIPQGVAAMLMKHTLRGTITIDDPD